MQINQGLRQSLIVTRHPAKTRYPAEASFDYQSTQQQHKASFRRREFDDFEPDSVLCGRIGCVFTCVALIDIGDLDCFAGLGLHPPGKFRDLGLILFIGGCHAQGERMPERIDRLMDLTAFQAVGAVIVDASAALWHRLQDPVLGLSLRPSAIRNTARRS
jgi:hypothetical protein